MSSPLKNRAISTVIGFVGGSIVTLIVLGLYASIFETGIHSVLAGAITGGVVLGSLCFFFPRLGEILIEFIG